MIKVGYGADIQANAVINSNATAATNPTTSVIIGANASIGAGATVLGPSTVGNLTTGSKAVGVGPNALIDGATIEPGSIVGPLARVGPGVTVPSGFYVLPGANVTTDAEASDPTLGKVVPVTATQLGVLDQTVVNFQALAAGYSVLYQGNSATGVSSLAPTVFNGNLTTIEGASAQPGSANTGSFEPTTATAPSFLAPGGVQVQYTIPTYRARAVGHVVFWAHAHQTGKYFSRGDVVLGDQGQPITFNGPVGIGNNATIDSPGNTKSTDGAVTFGTGTKIGANAVVRGGPGGSFTIGNNVSIGGAAVIVGSTIGDGSTIGARAYVANSKLPTGTNVPAGAIVVNNVTIGSIQW